MTRPRDLEDRMDRALMPTLSETLAAVGWTHRPGTHGRRIVTDAGGIVRGDLTAGQTWALLRKIGKVTQ